MRKNMQHGPHEPPRRTACPQAYRTNALQGLPSAARLPAAPSPAEIQREYVPRSLRRMLQLRRALTGGARGSGGPGAADADPAAPRQRNKFKGTVVPSREQQSAGGSAGRDSHTGAGSRRRPRVAGDAGAGAAGMPLGHAAAPETSGMEQDDTGASAAAGQPPTNPPHSSGFRSLDDAENGGHEDLLPAAKRRKSTVDIDGNQHVPARPGPKAKVSSP